MSQNRVSQPMTSWSGVQEYIVFRLWFVLKRRLGRQKSSTFWRGSSGSPEGRCIVTGIDLQYKLLVGTVTFYSNGVSCFCQS